MSAGLIQLTKSTFHKADVTERRRFAVAITDGASLQERLSVEVKCLLFLAESVINRADVGERCRFAAAITDGAMQRERLNVVVERFLDPELGLVVLLRSFFHFDSGR
jgi:hypothetical protein